MKKTLIAVICDPASTLSAAEVNKAINATTKRFMANHKGEDGTPNHSNTCP